MSSCDTLPDGALFGSDLWQTALEKYASATRLTVRLFDADARAVFGPVYPTPLFQLFDEAGYDPGILSECARRCIAQTEKRPPVFVAEIHGLAVVGASLQLEGKIVGAAVGGYAFANFFQVSDVQRLARQSGIAFGRVWEIVRKQPPVPQQRLIVHGELLQVLGDALLRENHRPRQYERAAAIVNSSDDAISSEDLNGVTMSWNAGAERLFGYSASEAVGKPLAGLIDPSGLNDERHIVERIGRNEKIDHYETAYRRSDRSSIEISLTASPITNANGSIVGVSRIARDISDHKRAQAALRESESRYRTLFEATGTPYLVLAADAPRFTITDVNSAYLNVTMTQREALMGRGIFEAFPGNPDDPGAIGVRDLKASFERVLETGRADAMAVLKFDIRRPDGTFEERYWVPHNTPIFDGAREPTGIIHHAEDVTDYIRLRARDAEKDEQTSRLEAEIVAAGQRLQRTNNMLRESEARFRNLVEEAADGIFVATADGRYVEMNPSGCGMLGMTREEVLDRFIPDVLDPGEHYGIDQVLASFADGKVHRSEWRFRRKDGSTFTGEIAGRQLTDGSLQGVVRDITERKKMEEHRRLLIDELNHTLATVQSFASQTLRNAKSTAEARLIFDSRLMALAKAHDVLTHEHWEGADLSKIVLDAIAAYSESGRASRFQVTGPELRLQPKSALALSMALHELATNAVKYGALLNGTGGVKIEWHVSQNEQQRRFRLRWIESGGPPVEKPRRRGFGSRLVEQGLSQDLGGEVRLIFERPGLLCTIDAPLTEVAGRGRTANMMRELGDPASDGG